MSGLMRETSCPHCGGLHPPGTDACPGPNLAGRTLAGGVHVLEKLGETSRWSLYRAEIAHTGAEVELMTLRPDASWSQFPGETSELDRLWDRLSRARGINHSNIASVKAMGRIPEGPRYIALEVLRGQLLSEVVVARGALSVEEAADLILQAASGLQAAHGAGLLHGSLSPDNILVTRTADNRPLVKLIRFGLGQHATAPPAGSNESTDYTAPERLAGHAGDERSDIFSLGAVLYHLLTGEPPSPDPAEDELIPEAARPVVSKALDPQPGRRYGTVAAFARALEAIRLESAVQEEPAGGGWRGVVAIAAGLGIVAAGFWVLSSPEQSRPQPRSERRVAVGVASPAAQAGDSRGSLPAPADTTPASSPNSGTAAPSPTHGSRRESIATEAPVSEKALSTTPESVAIMAREQEQAGSAAVTPGNVPPGAGGAAGPGAAQARAPVTSRPAAPADSALGYSPEISAEALLDRTPAMRLALSDVLRLQIVAEYEEVRPGLLALSLGDGYRTSTALEYNLRQLYAAYVELLNYPDSQPVMELWQKGGKIGEYTQDGLMLGPTYVTPR